MTQLTTPLYSAYEEDKAMVDFFLFDKKIGPGPKLRVYPEVNLRYVPSLTQYESVNPMSSNAQPTA